MFQLHGDFSVTRKDNLLIIFTQGPFDTLTAKAFTHEVSSYIREMPERWGQIITTNQNNLFIPEAEEHITIEAKKKNARGCVVSAIILTDTIEGSRFVLELQLSRIYTSSNIEFRIFDNTLEAQQWVSEYLTD